MSLANEDFEKLRELEESLWRAETRFDRDHMDKVMTDDFIEFGRSGKVYTKAESLSASIQEILAKFPLKDFQVHEVAEGAVLITYVSEVQYDSLETANRSSIWVKRNGQWRLRFHQGTPVSIYG